MTGKLPARACQKGRLARPEAYMCGVLTKVKDQRRKLSLEVSQHWRLDEAVL